MGSGMMSSPRRALEIWPPRSRARMKWSSASYADIAVMPTLRQERAAGRGDGQERSA
jgi:hypothetical protein